MIPSSEMTATETAPSPSPSPGVVTVTVTETERKEILREVSDEEEEKIRRQKKLEEALEAKSLRRIISAYLKYFTFSFLNFHSSLSSSSYIVS